MQDRAREPHCYRVTVWDHHDRARRYLVQTWYGEHKAVAIATIVHAAEAPDHHLHRIEVEDLGLDCSPVDASDRRLYDDRMEW